MIRNSKLAGLRRSASQWINWHRKTTPTAYPVRNMREINILVSHTERIGQKCTDETRSDFRTAVTFMNRLHRESGEERPEPIPFHQNPSWHPSSSSSSSWWQWEKWRSSNFIMFLNCVVAGSSTADGNLLQPTGCKQYTSHVTFFSCLCALVMLCHTTSAQVFVRVIPSMCHAPE